MKMSDEFNNPLDAAIADAIRHLPEDPPPPDLLPSVMAEVRREASRPKFSLSWLELVLITFFGLMIAMAFGTFGLLAGTIEPGTIDWALMMVQTIHPRDMITAGILFLSFILVAVLLLVYFNLSSPTARVERIRS